MENNIIFICPSWEDRSLLGFKQDCDDVKTNKVIALRKEHPINESEITDCIEKITSILLLKKAMNIKPEELLCESNWQIDWYVHM